MNIQTSSKISNTYDQVRNNVVDAIKSHLKRIGRDFNSDEHSEEIEFLSWDVANVDNEITEIQADGTVINEGRETNFLDLINEGQISILDAISVLESLEKL